ncbi:Leucine-rich repeat-containing protein 15, partial [Pseudolycoriella hygida]
VTFAQTIRCRYVNYGSVYGCELTINNPNGFNGFSAIEGTHLSGYNNARVGVLYRVSGVTTNVPQIICNTFPNLHSLDLHNTGMLTIDDNAFRGCTQVAQLDLWQNKINSISANAFDSLRNVQFLNLEQNNLTSIAPNLFANQAKLQMLYLSQNKFSDFPVGIFRPLESLLHLGIGFSNLSEINPQWFGSNNTKLVDLHVGGNILPDTFAGLTSLSYLQTGYAPIRQIHAGAFRGLGNLKTLIISHCQLNQIQSTAFEDLTSLNYINLEQNEIADIGNSMVPLVNLREASFRNNYLTTIRRSNFGTVTNLDALNFDGNMIN